MTMNRSFEISNSLISVMRNAMSSFVLFGVSIGTPAGVYAQVESERFTDSAFGASAEGEAGEEEDEIETDRDSFTPSTRTVRPGRLVFESAYTFIDNRDVKDTHSLPEIVARLGVTDNVELRFGWNYEIGGAGSPVSGNAAGETTEGSELEEESRILYGAKLFLTEQSGLFPRSSAIVQGFTPTSGESNLTTASATYVFGWELPNKSAWDYAIRYGASGHEHDRFGVWSPSVVWKFPLAEKCKAHIEYFGVFSDGRESETTQHFISPGAHYLISKDTEIGMRCGWGLNEQSPEFFSNFGIGLRY